MAIKRNTTASIAEYQKLVGIGFAIIFIVSVLGSEVVTRLYKRRYNEQKKISEHWKEHRGRELIIGRQKILVSRMILAEPVPSEYQEQYAYIEVPTVEIQEAVIVSGNKVGMRQDHFLELLLKNKRRLLIILNTTFKRFSRQQIDGILQQLEYLRLFPV